MINFFSKHKIAVLFIFLFIVLIPIVFYYVGSFGKPGIGQPTISPTPARPEVAIPENISTLQKSRIGKTTTDQINKLPKILKKETLQNGDIRYSFESPLNSRPNEIITKNGVAIFEKELTPESPGSLGYTTISAMISQYGQPEKIIQGSKFYGWMIKYYIYASKGFAFIGNETTNEVYEFNFFEPTTIDGYLSSYGGDVSYSTGPPRE